MHQGGCPRRGGSIEGRRYPNFRHPPPIYPHYMFDALGENQTDCHRIISDQGTYFSNAKLLKLEARYVTVQVTVR